jgi:hypothetical protein
METAIVVHATSLFQNQRILYAVQSPCPTLQNHIDFELSNIDGKNVISRWSNTTIAQPADRQFAAKMKVSGATTFYRTDPLTLAIGSAYGWSAAQTDAFFVAAAKL